MQLIKTYEGEVINLENVTRIFFDEDVNKTKVVFVGGGGVELSCGDVTNLLWNGRRDFTEVNYGA